MASGQSAHSTNTPAVPQASTQSSPFGGTIVEDVIARVNDQIISRADFERASQDLEQRARQQNLSPAQVEAERKDLLRDLVDQQLLLSKGKELDINGETELIRELNEIRKENHLDTMEDLQKAAESQGVNYEDFKANIRNRIITQQVIREQVGRRLNITQADVQRYYQQHKSEFNKPESVRLSEIMVPVTDPAATDAAMAKANDFEAKLKAGGDFDALMKQASAGAAAPEGGDLGSFPRGKLSKVLEDKTFALKAGEFTEPIQTKQGVIILKVTEHAPGGQATLKEVQPQVEDALAQERVQPAVRAYLAQARMEAYIVYKPGYVDSAAVVSPNPILYSAYTPPAVKKKKKVNRTRYRGRSRRGGDTQTASAPLGGPLGTSQATPGGVPSLADAPHTAAVTDGTVAPSGAAASGSVPSSEMASNTPTPGAATTSAPGSGVGNTEPDTGSTGKTRESNRKKSPKDAASTMKPGKKEKIRFGHAPRETLPSNNNTRNIDAHATADNSTAGSLGTPGDSSAENQVASADIPEETSAPPKEAKKRFSARAKLPKVKKSKTPPVDPLAPPPPTTDELATQQTQAAPLGLAGDTMKPAKKKKVKPTEKTRLQDGKKPLSTSGEATGETGTATDQAKPQAAAPAAPLDTNPVQTPPTNTQGVPTPGDGSSTTPPPPPQ